MEGSAFETEDDYQADRRREVVGGRTFRGWEHGDTFSEPMTKDEEARAIARGNIRVVGQERVVESAPPPVAEEQTGDGDADARQE